MTPLFPGRNPDGPSDAGLDAMLEKAFRQQAIMPPKEATDSARLARAFALEQDWAMPQPERRKWHRCVLVILGALLATLLLGRMLESLKSTEQRPAPRAELVRLSQ
jgi:hypothetical protein